MKLVFIYDGGEYRTLWYVLQGAVLGEYRTLWYVLQGARALSYSIMLVFIYDSRLFVYI